VHLGKEWATSNLVAIGKMSKSFIEEYGLAEELEREKEIFRIVEEHPLMIKFLGSFEDRDNIYQVFEYAKNGTLKELLKTRHHFDVDTARAFIA